MYADGEATITLTLTLTLILTHTPTLTHTQARGLFAYLGYESEMVLRVGVAKLCGIHELEVERAQPKPKPKPKLCGIHELEVASSPDEELLYLENEP